MQLGAIVRSEGGEGNRWKFAFAASEAESRFLDLQEWGSSHLSLQSEINSPRHTFSPQDLLLFLIHASAF